MSESVAADGSAADGLHDELSALLDGELDDGAALALADRLAVDDALQAELDATDEVRLRVRSASVVAPAGALEEVVASVRATLVLERRRARVRSVGIGVFATLALFLAGTSSSGTTAADGTPLVGSLLGQHSAVLDVSAGFGSGSTAATAELQSIHHLDDVTQAIFRTAEGQIVSVFAQEGEVAWSRLPAEGERVEIAGRIDAWLLSNDETNIVVVERDGTVFTFVGEGPVDAGLVEGGVLDVEVLPTRSESDPSSEGWWARVGRLADEVLDGYSAVN